MRSFETITLMKSKFRKIDKTITLMKCNVQSPSYKKRETPSFLSKVKFGEKT